MKFCGMCGTRLRQACPICGFANPLDYRFCGQCGAPLAAAVEPAAVEAAPPAPAILPSAPVLSPEPVPEAGELQGERRVATIILADVQGSTDLLEQVGTEAWVEIMNRVFQILETEIYRFGGVVDQFRGDGLVAFFGATSAHEDDPERAVLAALSMQESLSGYAADLAEHEGIDLQLRVGVNTGEVIVTSVGDRRRYSEETAMGEAIALAARMETAAEPGTVLVSENTYHLTEDLFVWQPLGEIKVKGVSQSLAVYRPSGLRLDREWARDWQSYGLAVPLIGRDEEFQTLKHCVEELYDGRGSILMVTGEKGMGKTFLVARVQQYFVRQEALLAEAQTWEENAPAEHSHPPCVTWLYGRSRSYDQSCPFTVWLDLLQNWLGRPPEEPPENTCARLRQRAEELWGEQLSEYYPYLATFLSLPLEKAFTERIKHLDAEGLQQQFFRVIRSWVETLSRRGPLVLAFSDMQWADTTSLDLLKYCLPLCDTETLLWLLVFRPERTSPVWEFRHYVETEYPHRLTDLALPPFTAAQSAELIGRLIGPETLPEETRALVVEKAEGNPYYIQELIDTLIAEGVLMKEPGTGMWQATRAVTSLELPDSLQSLLLARIDRLSPEERHVLQMAAVIGPVFWLNVLRALAGDAHALQSHLTALQRAQLIHERRRMPDLGMEYAFNSSLLRDVAYESLLNTQRVTYHLQVAEYLENLGAGESQAAHYGLLAYHYRFAGKLRQELHYTLKAAEQARQVYANAEALEYYTRALELLDEMAAQAADEEQSAICARRFEVLDGRREVFFLSGDWEKGAADARALLPLAQQLSDEPAWLIDALLQQPGVAHVQGREELDAGIAMAQEALQLSQQLGDRRREMRSLIAITNLRNLGNDPSWQESGKRALELARQLDDPRAEIAILLRMGWAYGPDSLERSREYLEAAMPIVQRLDDKAAEISLLSAMQPQIEREGDYVRALTDYAQKRLRISREIGDRFAEGLALSSCGQLRGIWLGDYEGGLSLEREALAIWETLTGRLYPLLRIAQIQIALGKYDEALATLERARPAVARDVSEVAQAGFALVSAILYNTWADHILGKATGLRPFKTVSAENLAQAGEYFRQALTSSAQIQQLVADNLISRQYRMAALCETAAAHLGLTQCLPEEEKRQEYRRQALEASQAALDVYQSFGFVQIIECTSEEILFRHGQALAANGQQETAEEYLRRAYDEMQRKYALIPTDSPYRRTYLENISLHRELLTLHAAR